ncbi:rhodopsin, GQ-coupled-like [Battus philenor]|uniref:rhodopsin, GQ-coupled-like n=1 Tax=Battus philenor TaxID=42288 RepID=UPI0035CFA0D1
MYGKLIETEDCFWEGVFDNSSKKTLITGWVLTGRVAFFLVIWLNLNLWCTALRNNLKYQNLAAFTTIMSIRRGYNYIFYFLRYMEYDWYFDIHNCSTYGFLDTFLGVYEVESLTHVCIERYVVAKYIANGWPVKKWHYVLYQGLCLFFSLLYSLSPSFGIGSYVKDFSCLTCTYNMILPDTWEKYVVLTIFLLRSVKPLFFMMIMRFWTQQMEGKYDEKNVPWKEVRFAHIVDVITTASIMCWMPITVIRGLVIIAANFLQMELNLEPFASYIRWAIWIEWFTPAVITLTLLYVDHLLRAKMFGVDKKEEDVVKVYEKES